MNCINCGAFLTDTDLDYCPHCGANVLIQKKVDYLSKLYYNQGLEKASIRDLSGAIHHCMVSPLSLTRWFCFSLVIKREEKVKRVWTSSLTERPAS